MRIRIFSLLALGTSIAGLHAQQSTIHSTSNFAYGANLGWISLRPERPNPGDGVIVTDTHFSGFAWSDSTGWINFGDGTPADGIRYGNTDGADSGVNHDGAGNLSGLAWSANLGWINFGWAAPADPNRPRFDLQDGNFSGYAWSSNTGWITLGSGVLKTDFICRPDTDNDGISDTWELENSATSSRGNLTTLTATGDADGDGVSDRDEYFAGTNPLDAADKLDLLAFAPGEAGTLLTWTSRPTRLYRTGQSTDLTTWTYSDLFAPDAGSATSRQAFHPPGPRRFFRVEAAMPLPK